MWALESLDDVINTGICDIVRDILQQAGAKSLGECGWSNGCGQTTGVRLWV